MWKKIGTLALLYGFFLSSASFTPVEEGVIAKTSYGERHVSGMSSQSGKIESYSADQFANLEDCLAKVKVNHPKANETEVKNLCNSLTQEALKDGEKSVEVMNEKAKSKAAKTL